MSRLLAYGLQVEAGRPIVADSDGCMSARCTAIQLLASTGSDGRVMRCGIISSCQSAAISEIAKRS